MNEGSCQNNDKILYREKNSTHYGSFDDSLFVTEGGGIGINVAGTVYVKPLKEWHQLSNEDDRLKAELEQKTRWLDETLARGDRVLSQLSVAKECLKEIATARTNIGNATVTATMAFNCLQDTR